MTTLTTINSSSSGAGATGAGCGVVSGEFSSPATSVPAEPARTPRKPMKCRQCAVHGVDAGASREHTSSCPHAPCECQACLGVKRSRAYGRNYHSRNRPDNAAISDTPADVAVNATPSGSDAVPDDHCYARTGPTTEPTPSSSPPPGRPGTSNLESAGEAPIPPGTSESLEESLPAESREPPETPVVLRIPPESPATAGNPGTPVAPRSLQGPSLSHMADSGLEIPTAQSETPKDTGARTVLRDDNETVEVEIAVEAEVEVTSDIGTASSTDSATAGKRSTPLRMQILERRCRACRAHALCKGAPAMHFVIGPKKFQCPFQDCDCSRCIASRNLKEKKRQFEAQYGKSRPRPPAPPKSKKRSPRSDSEKVARRPVVARRITTSSTDSTSSSEVASVNDDTASVESDAAASPHRNAARGEGGVAPAAPPRDCSVALGVLEVPVDADRGQARRHDVFDLLWGRDDVDVGVPLKCPDCSVSLASEALQDHVDAVHMRLVPLQRVVRLFGLMHLGPRDQDAGGTSA